ncbi:MAG: hypothetical protein U0792_03625 [Gemmataceae bacterium]
MNANDLPEYVHRLIRPRLALRTERLSATDSIVGVWGGEGVVPLPLGAGSRTAEEYAKWGRDPEEDEPRHWLSVDCEWLGRNGYGLSGCLSVYELAHPNHCYVAVTDARRVDWARVESGTPLFGQEEQELPTEHVLDAYLTNEEKESIGWCGRNIAPSLEEYFHTAFMAGPLNQNWAAVLGGWHIHWPDGPPDLPKLRELNERIQKAHGPGCFPEREMFRCEPYRLVLWTLRDCEPWLEVWGDDSGELHVVPRIS